MSSSDLSSEKPNVIGRIAPSPSGRMHLGNAFSALIAWAHARSQEGSFVLRLEDLDERCRKKEFVDGLVEDLRWLGIDWDGPVVTQSERLARYEDALRTIEQAAKVYPCFCSRADLHAASAPHASDGTPVYPGTCLTLSDSELADLKKSRRHALRLHVPDERITFHDEIQGDYEQCLARESGDFVLRRSDGVYAYQLVCVVDDIASEVTEVVRGSDLLSSTPRQMLLYRLLGANPPRYAHHPLLLAEDGRRLAKREEDCTISSLRERGVPSEKIVGYLAYLAGQIDKPRSMSPDELISIFDASRIPREDIIVSADLIDEICS